MSKVKPSHSASPSPSPNPGPNPSLEKDLLPVETSVFKYILPQLLQFLS